MSNRSKEPAYNLMASAAQQERPQICMGAKLGFGAIFREEQEKLTWKRRLLAWQRVNCQQMLDCTGSWEDLWVKALFPRNHLCKVRCSRRPWAPLTFQVPKPGPSHCHSWCWGFSGLRAGLKPCCIFRHSYANKPTAVWKLIPERGRSCLISTFVTFLLSLHSSSCSLTPLGEFCIFAPAEELDLRSTSTFLTAGYASSYYSDIPVQGKPSHTQPRAQLKPSDRSTNKQTHF